jgi:hypothetical protein
MCDKKNCIDSYHITYHDYITKKKDLYKLKAPILKSSCRQHKLKVSGKKSILIARLDELFTKIKYAIIIQKYIRMRQCYIYYTNRGPGSVQRNLCNNNSDFITMEPLNEINFEYFFSYRDDANFIYGFNIVSLMNLIKNKHKFENPYNRSIFPDSVKKRIIRLYNNTCIVDNSFRKQNDIFSNKETSVYTNRVINRNRISSVDNYNPTFDRVILLTRDLNNRLEYLRHMRSLQVNERVDRLFTEIDNLGNYTNNSWFNNLSHMQYVRFYRTLYDVWCYRGQIPFALKKKICPFHDPFVGIFNRTIYRNSITLEQIKKACLIVMENLIYSSVDVECRKISALHVLSCLTVISPPARNAIPWLYESIA